MDDGSVRFCGWFPSTDDPPRRLKLRRYYGRGQLRRCNCFSSCICDLTGTSATATNVFYLSHRLAGPSSGRVRKFSN